MQELEPKFLQVGDTLTEENSGAQYEIHRLSNKNKGKFAIHLKEATRECRWIKERTMYFRKELCRNNGVWKTCLRGDKFDSFILNENKSRLAPHFIETT